MAHDISALEQIKQFERELLGRLAALDIDLIGKDTAKTIAAIKRLAQDSKLDIRDFEMADSRAEREKNGKIAAKRLHELRQYILAASERGIFSAIDVAELSVQIDSITDVIVAQMR